jgi:hypothetical protein
MNFNNLAGLIIQGELANSSLDYELTKYFWGEEYEFIKIGDPLILRIFCDSYDNSIEIDVSNILDIEEFVEDKITKEFIDSILQSGCSRFWVNFYDSYREEKIAEVYCNADGKSFKYKD